MQTNQEGNEIIFNQIELARGWTIDVSESILHEVVDVKPDGFNLNCKKSPSKFYLAVDELQGLDLP